MINQINKILFTSDLTDESLKVFEQTVALAFQTGASITIVHVMEEASSENEKRMVNYIDREVYERVRQENQEEAKNLLIGKQKHMPAIENAMREMCEASANKVCGSGQPVEIDAIHILYGNPALKILEVAQESRCDLIAMGYHKKGSILKALAGRAEKGVMKRSNKPLFLVPLED